MTVKYRTVATVFQTLISNMSALHGCHTCCQHLNEILWGIIEFDICHIVFNHICKHTPTSAKLNCLNAPAANYELSWQFTMATVTLGLLVGCRENSLMRAGMWISGRVSLIDRGRGGLLWIFAVVIGCKDPDVTFVFVCFSSGSINGDSCDFTCWFTWILPLLDWPKQGGAWIHMDTYMFFLQILN